MNLNPVLIEKQPPEVRPDAVGEQSLADKWRRVYRPIGIFGLLLTPLVIPVLRVNVQILRLTLKLVFLGAADADLPSLPFPMFMGNYQVTTFVALAFLISVGQVILAAAATHGWIGDDAAKKDMPRLVRSCAGLGLVIFATSEVMLSYERSNDDHFVSALIAAGVIVVEAVFGVCVVEGFILPFLHAVFATIAAVIAKVASLLSVSRAIRIRRRPSLVEGDSLGSTQVWPGMGKLIDEGMAFLNRTAPLIGLLAATLIIVGALFLTGCESPRPVAFFIGVDRTCSVPDPEFSQYAEMARQFVLDNLHPGDEADFMPIGRSDAKNGAVAGSFARPHLAEFLKPGDARSGCSPLDLAKQDFSKRVAPLFNPRDCSSPKSSDLSDTDIGAAIGHFKERARKGEKSVVIFLTDGRPTGPQTAPPQDNNADLEIWFVGIHDGTDQALRRLAQQFKVRVKLVHYSGDWPMDVKDFKDAIGRNESSNTVSECK